VWEPEEVWILEPEAPTAEPGAGRSTPQARDKRSERADRNPRPSTPSGATSSSEGGSGGPRHTVPRPVVDELASAAGASRGSKLAGRLADASHAYDRERYQEARRMLRALVDEVPDAVAVQELYGLTLYRMGQWAQAAKHLERYRELSGSYDQHPVLADCDRALRRYPAAAQLWEELREASPSAELVAEGRIVAAGCLADQGDLQGAIATLERSAKRVNHPQDHHLRQWYALADLYERAGDLPRARELFGRVGTTDPDAFDVRQRLRALR
jgi:tetratricopeptide (TPR) repeat protein